MKPSEVTVAPGVWLTLSYHLYDEEDALVESSDEVGALSALFGFGQLSPPLERVLDGARVGDTKSVVLPKNEAFGERDPDKVLEVEREDFPPDVKSGDEFQAEQDDGTLLSVRVLEVGSESVVMDTNHPLAGQEIRMEVTVESARAATSAEIQKAEELLAQDPPSRPLVPAGRLLRGRGED